MSPSTSNMPAPARVHTRAVSRLKQIHDEINAGRCRNSRRDFHAGRIRRLALTERYFDSPAGWNADEYLRRGFYMMRGGRSTTVEIVFDSYQARWMRERQTFHPEERREDLPDGSMRLTFPVGRNGLDAVARFCLAYAGHARAVRPRRCVASSASGSHAL